MRPDLSLTNMTEICFSHRHTKVSRLRLSVEAAQLGEHLLHLPEDLAEHWRLLEPHPIGTKAEDKPHGAVKGVVLTPPEAIVKETIFVIIMGHSIEEGVPDIQEQNWKNKSLLPVTVVCPLKSNLSRYITPASQVTFSLNKLTFDHDNGLQVLRRSREINQKHSFSDSFWRKLNQN